MGTTTGAKDGSKNSVEPKRQIKLAPPFFFEAERGVVGVRLICQAPHEAHHCALSIEAAELVAEKLAEALAAAKRQRGSKT